MSQMKNSPARLTLPLHKAVATMRVAMTADRPTIEKKYG